MKEIDPVTSLHNDLIDFDASLALPNNTSNENRPYNMALVPLIAY